MIALYLVLLGSGVGLFVLSYVAQFRLATLLRVRFPQHWQVIVEADQGKPAAWHQWVRMQRVLRSPALPALRDPATNQWRNLWRCGPWLGWLCWMGALAMRRLH